MLSNEILRKVGLSENAAQIYLALLERGVATISQIARDAGIHRPLIYKELPSLVGRGLVTKSLRGKRTLYSLESPAVLREMVDELSSEVDRLIPELETVYNSRGNRPVVKVLEGRRGIQHVFTDLVTSLKNGDEFYRYSSAKDSKKNEQYLPKDYRAIRDQKQLERLVITSASKASEKRPRLERDIRSVPEDSGLFDYDVTELIYGDKVALIDYNTETAYVVESSKIAEFQKKIFKTLFFRL